MLSEPGFQGRIGRTHHDSQPWWPPPPSGLGGPNVLMIVLDDTGFSHFGCYGSTLRTPHIDALAAGGLRYTSFHTTALCSPTRACLLSGRNHHAVGMRGVSNWNTGFPHMRGGITPRAATIAELLRTHGYATYAAGKWHLAPMEETSAAGPHTNWPLQKGFDKFYGFLQGESDQFHPELTRDNHHVDAPTHLPDGQPYHFSDDIVDQSATWIRDLVSVRPDRPFFLYLAFGAMHSPHQAPEEYLQRWRGAFDEGYDVWRDRWYHRQVELGIVPEGTLQAPRNPGVPAWHDLTANQKAFACRLQEAYAAMLEHTDHQIGRLMDFLRAQQLLDDTLVMVLSDNGASREGGPFGVMDEFSFFNGMWEDIDQIVAHKLDDIGGPHSHSNYPWGWAQAGNSPLRWYKQNTYGGGVRDPLVVHWPAGIDARGEIRHQFCHAVDIAATVLDITHAPAPDVVAGVEQIPMHGRSLAPTFGDGDAPPPRAVQYFEQMGHRGIWALDADGRAWKATTYHEANTPYDDDEWELFCLTDDFSECRNLAAEQPAKLREMIDLWWTQAGEMGVLPLDDRTIELFGGTPRPGTPHERTTYQYLAPISHIPSDVCPPLGGRNWTLTIDLTINLTGDGDAAPVGAVTEGVLYARGTHSVGHAFYVKDGELRFHYNALGDSYTVRGPIDLTAGDHTVVASFTREGKGGVLTLSVDGTEIATGPIPKLVRMLGSTGLDIGRDAMSPKTSDYTAPFPFTGAIHRASFDIHSRRSAADVEAIAKMELAESDPQEHPMSNPAVLDSLQRRMRAMHSLYHQAVDSMDIEHVNHFEREGVVPIAFCLFHITNMWDASFMLMTGTPPIWNAQWQERVQMAIDDHGKHRTVDEMIHQRIGNYEAFKEYLRAVMARTEAWLADLDPAELDRVVIAHPLPPQVASTYSARVAGPQGITLLDATECWIYQHGLRHMGEIELARGLVGLGGMTS